MAKRKRYKTLERLEKSKEISSNFKQSGVGFAADAVKSSRLSNVDLWVVSVKNEKTGKAAMTTCCKKNIKDEFENLAHRLLCF